MNFIKKILMCTLIISALQSNVSAFELSSVNNYMNSANDFIETSIVNGESQWDNFVISDYHKLYDFNLNENGYVFDLSSNNKNGYIIVLKYNNQYIVTEASYDSESPYHVNSNNNDNLLIYASPLEYYTTDKKYNAECDRKFVNIETNDIVSKDDISIQTFNYYSDTNVRSVPGETIRYLNSYNTKFNQLSQNLSTNCIPTSAAMALNYMHKTYQITLNITDISSIRNKINEYMCGGSNVACAPNDTMAMNAINSFGNNYSSPKISTRNDGFWGDLTFQTVINQINSNKPFIMMFNANTIGYNVNHATTCVGYKTLNNDSTGGITYNYTIVRDPGNGNVPTKTVLWNGTNVHGYYLIYIG